MSILSLGLPTWYDQSVIILNQVVGSAQNMVDPSIPAPGSYDSNNVLVPLPLFASMMMYFNQALLGCGTILFAIMVFVGTINTAAEGQFLGKDWHSIWTPVRLIFGLLFIVPLQSGLCIGQKIILYAVLIGVNMGTTVWQQTINQIFNNSAQPPIPTYLNNTVTQMVEQVFMMQAVEAIVNNMPSPPTSGQISIPINQYFSIQGSLSSSQYPVLPSYISTAMANQISGLCGQLYSGDQSDCAGQLNSVLSGAQSLNSSVVGNGINYFFFIGSNLTGATSPISGNDLQGYPLPNFWKSQGDILVQGSYNYTFPPAPGTNINISGIATPPACPAKKGDIAGDTYCQVQSLISTYVAPASSKGENNPAPPPDCPKNPSPGQASCSMQAAVTAILDDAQLNVAISQFETALNTQNNNNNSNNSNPNNNVPTAPAYHDKDSENDTGTAQPSQNPPLGPPPNTYINYNACPVGTTPVPPSYAPPNCSGTPLVDPNSGATVFPVSYNLNDYWIPGISNNPAVPAPYIDLQLNNSWWQAGSSYLVIDNQLANSLAELWQQLQVILKQVSQTGSSHFTGNFTASYSASIWELGTTAASGSPPPGSSVQGTCGVYNLDYTLAPNATNTNSNGAVTPYSNMVGPNATGGLATLGFNVAQSSPANSSLDQVSAFYTCNADEARGTAILSTTLPVSTTSLPVPNWTNLIDPYNPNPADTSTNEPHINTAEYPNLYQDLVYMPPDEQSALAILLTMAQNQYQSSNSQNYSDYITLMPYLQGMINVLIANGILQTNSGSSLPVNQVLTQIFSGLLGADAADPVASINSVIQQVYNLGNPPAAPGLVAKQFSLIQQAQSTGISMIMVCITSLQSIVEHYENQYQSLQTNLELYVHIGMGAGATAGIASAFAANPLWAPVANALAGAAAASADAMNLVMQAQTINQLTTIGMTLMYLPIVMFVLTSLFTAGVQFALIVPLTPYILFWAGEIAWLLGVLEAIVAAPIIMLGLAHPGGHQYMGHSVPAVKMLLSVVFRPVLMVIGMITGILLTYVVITFSAQGFHIVATSLLNSVSANDQQVQGILACLMLIVYCSFIVLAFNKCFSTIYLIPDKVMEWIGGHGEQAGVQDLQTLSQGAQQAAGQAAQAGGEGAQKGISAQESQAQQKSQFDQSEVSSVKSNSQSTGQGVAEGYQARSKKQQEDANNQGSSNINTGDEPGG